MSSVFRIISRFFLFSARFLKASNFWSLLLLVALLSVFFGLNFHPSSTEFGFSSFVGVPGSSSRTGVSSSSFGGVGVFAFASAFDSVLLLTVGLTSRIGCITSYSSRARHRYKPFEYWARLARVSSPPHPQNQTMIRHSNCRNQCHSSCLMSLKIPI